MAAEDCQELVEIDLLRGGEVSPNSLDEVSPNSLDEVSPNSLDEVSRPTSHRLRSGDLAEHV